MHTLILAKTKTLAIENSQEIRGPKIYGSCSRDFEGASVTGIIIHPSIYEREDYKQTIEIAKICLAASSLQADIKVSNIEKIRNGDMYIHVNSDEVYCKVSMEMLHEVIRRIFPKDQVEINEDTFDTSVSITGKPDNPDFFCTIRGAKEKISLRQIHREIFYQSHNSNF